MRAFTSYSLNELKGLSGGQSMFGFFAADINSEPKPLAAYPAAARLSSSAARGNAVEGMNQGKILAVLHLISLQSADEMPFKIRAKPSHAL